MKRIMISVVLALAMLLTCIPAYAQSGSYRFDGAEEVMTDEAMVLESINDFLAWETANEFTLTQLNKNELLRFYPCMDIGDNAYPSKAQIEAVKENGDYVYLHILSANGLTYLSTVAKGRSLSEELKGTADEELLRYILEHEGKWYCNDLSTCYGKIDYKQYVIDELKKQGINSADIRFVTWFPREEEGEFRYKKAALCYPSEEAEPIVIDLRKADKEAGKRPRWFKQYGKWHYHLDLYTNADDGWYKISGKWYYFDDWGEMQTGWIKDSGKWYYLTSTGAMKTGWLKLGGKWYYLNSSGAMLTGWVKDNGKWYYLTSTGAMKTGWLKLGGKWYYLNSSGAMLTGWQIIDSYRYYFNSGGAMASNTTIGAYKVDASGRRIK